MAEPRVALFCQRAVIGLLATLFLLLSIGWLTARWWLTGIGRWLATASQPVEADAIAVLSGGGPERLVHGIELYRWGLAPELWYTGDVPFPSMPKFTDGQLARQFALAEGVPREQSHSPAGNDQHLGR